MASLRERDKLTSHLTSRSLIILIMYAIERQNFAVFAREAQNTFLFLRTLNSRTINHCEFIRLDGESNQIYIYPEFSLESDQSGADRE